jgi:hypothetical protein
MCISINMCGLLLIYVFPKSIVHNNSHDLNETGLLVDTVSSNILLSLSKSFRTNTEDPQEITTLFITYTDDTVSL